MIVPLVVLGVVLAAAGISGTGLRASGIHIPLIESRTRQGLIVVFGILVICLGLLPLRGNGSSNAGPPTPAPQTVALDRTAPSTAPSTTVAPATAAAQASSPPPSSDSPASTTPSAAGGISPGDLLFTIPKVDISANHGISFSTQDAATNPTEWVGNSFYLSYGGYEAPQLMAANTVLLLKGEPADYQSCSTLHRYSGTIEMSQLAVGSVLCTQADDHRVAMLKVVHIPKYGDDPMYLEVQVTVWMGPN